MRALNTFKSALYFDLEMNCPDRVIPGVGHPEIIEVGVVGLDVVTLKVVCEANYLIRPLRPISRRCSKITGLIDNDFKGAKAFRDVIADIQAQWPGRATGIAWGDDGAILTRACRQHRVRMPFRRFIDLSQIVRETFLLENQLSLRAALELLGLEFDGCAHMALADARNTARLHAEIMRRLRAPGADTASVATNPSQPTWFGQLLANSIKSIHPA
jgi:inhibitor of KinA sporulation pathway (predicted exonuclease)